MNPAVSQNMNGAPFTETASTVDLLLGRTSASEPAVGDLDVVLGSLQEELADGEVSLECWQKSLLRPLREFLSRPGKQLRSRLVSLAWRVAGRTERPPIELVAIVELLHAGSLIVDDIEDGSDYRRGRAALHRLYGLPVALNVGNWLYCWPQTLLTRLDLPAERELHLQRRLAETLRRSHEGQALDLRLKLGEVTQNELPGIVKAISERKTGSLFRLAAELGSTAAGARPSVADAVSRFGLKFGIALQMLNDLQGLTPTRVGLERYEDLVHGRLTWCWVWLAETLPPREFRQLQAEAVRLQDHPEAAAELAAAMLDALGGTARQRIRTWLREISAEFQNAVEPCASFDEIRSDLIQLEQILG